MDSRGEQVGGFDLGAPLGKGGMGTVHQAVDRRTGRAVALKRLIGTDTRRLIAHFEREYRVLSEIDHPSVIKVYDYGLDDNGAPFYTMELLEGADLSALAPLPHARLCALAHDVASSLALLHARGFVHRDVTARNIRVLSNDRAKLIDFGAIAPMGVGEGIIGTPAYVPPEAVLGQSLDGRSDLYALGVAMYYALTRRPPYVAHHFSELRSAWQKAPTPVDQLVVDLHPDLSQLTMSLLSLDRSARPRSAAEVMDRLGSIGGLSRGELPAASRSYLVAPALEDRAVPRRRVKRLLRRTVEGRGGAFLFAGQRGVGRSRMLETTVLEARVLGVSVSRLSALHSRGAAFDACTVLLHRLLSNASSGAAAWAREHRDVCGVLFAADSPEGAPTLLDLASLSRPVVVDAVRQLLLACARERPLVIVADDLPLLDEPSVALLAALAADARSHPLAIVGTLDPHVDALAQPGLALLRDHSQMATLSPLDEAASTRLIASVFGDVAHMEAWAQRIHRMARGHPREIMAMLAHMVDAAIAQYSTGTWVLPSSLDEHPLPATFEDALRERMEGLSPGARLLAECHALSALTSLTIDQYLGLAPHLDPSRVYAAADELVVRDVIQDNRDGFVISHEGWTALIVAQASDATKRERHLALARTHEQCDSDVPLIAYHLLCGADDARALELLEAFCAEFTGETLDVFNVTRLSAPLLGEMFRLAVPAAERLGGGARLQGRLRQFMLAAGTVVEPQWFLDAAPDIQAMLQRESGWDHWQTLDPTLSPVERVIQAIQHAQARYDGAPAAGRYLSAGEAIRSLVMFTVGALAVSMATCDFRRLRTLPALLQPFAVLSPLIDTMMKNVEAVIHTVSGAYEEAAALYQEVLGRLNDDDVANLEHADDIRAGVAFGAAVLESRMGKQTASRRLELIADNPRLQGNVLGLRAVLAIQQGDWPLARQFKRQARRLSVTHAQCLFGQDALPAEVELYAIGRDLDAVKQSLNELRQLAKRYPTWRAVQRMAQADYARLRGKHKRALAHFEECLRLCGPQSRGEAPSSPWHHAAASKIELLTELGQVEKAVAYGCSLIADDQPSGQRHPRVLRALALAEARHGMHASAWARLQSLEQTLCRWGASGVELGLIYEALSWCALWSGDAAEFRRHAALTAEEYHRCSDSGFARRYAQLRRATRGSALVSDIPAAQSVERSPALHTSAMLSAVALAAESLGHCANAAERARAALVLLGELSGSVTGFLFVRGSTGVVLVSSLPGSATGDGLHEYVAPTWETEVGDQDDESMTSMLTSGPMSTAQYAATAWLDPQGRAHHLLPIRTEVEGSSRLVAVAVLGGRAVDLWSPSVLERARAIGDALLRAGDVVVATGSERTAT